MMINVQENKEKFVALARKYVKRDGLERLLAYLDKSDFYTAPASTKYHLCVDGGLCQHSLNVFERMVQLCTLYFKKEPSDETVFNGATIDEDGAFNMENIAIAALFHDICKAYCYKKDFKNVKVDGKWEQQEYWKWEEVFPYGHGTKSVFILQQFMRLTIDEALAIRFHMAGREDPLTDNVERQFAQVYEKNKFAYLLHAADDFAAWLDEYDDLPEKR